MIEPTLTTAAKRLYGIASERDVSPQDTHMLLEKFFTSPVDWAALEQLDETLDAALSSWLRTNRVKIKK